MTTQEKRHSWTIRARYEHAEEDTCMYQSACGPVTAEQVLNAPSVKRWIGGGHLVSITPTATPNTMTPLRYHDGQPVRLNDLFTAPRWGTCRVVSFDRPNRCATARNVSTGETFVFFGFGLAGKATLLERYNPADEAARLAAAVRSLLPHETERAVIGALKDSPVWREADKAIEDNEYNEWAADEARKETTEAEKRADALETLVRKWTSLFEDLRLYKELPGPDNEAECGSFLAVLDRMEELYQKPMP